MNSLFNNITKSVFKTVLCTLPLWGLGGCSSEVNPYEPGAPVSELSVGAYFPNSNKSEIIKADTDEKSFAVTVKREKTDKAVSIPVEVISKTDNISIPSTVEFAAGEEETSLILSYSDLETTPKFDIRLKEEYTNPYKIKDGSMEFAGNVFRLNLISDNISVRNYSDSYTTIFDHTTAVQAIYQMGNENMFIWRNFYGSGIDLKFKLDGTFNAENVKESHGNIIPLNHFYEDGAYGWWLMVDEDVWADDATWEYASWKVEGTDNEVADWMYFYYEYEGSSYFYIDFRPTESKSGGFYGYGFVWTGFVDSYSNVDNSVFYMYY